MPLAQWLLIIIVVVPLGLVITGRLRMDLAALLMAVILGILQFAGLAVLGPANTPQDAVKVLSGFSQPVVITLIALFILMRGLELTGATRWIALQIIRTGGQNTSRLIALFTSVTALLSLFMNNLAAGALVMPSAMEVSRRTGVRPSKLLIPVAYGSLLGGMAFYFTTANIIMSDMLRLIEPPQEPLGILAFTPTGGLVAIAGILFLWLMGNRILPDREPSSEQSLVRLTGTELEEYYQIGERLWRASVPWSSSVVGECLSETEFGRKWGIAVVAIQRNGSELIFPEQDQRIRANDQLLIIGREDRVMNVTSLGLEITPAGKQDYLTRRGIILAEIILAPHSPLEGKTLKDVRFRKQFGLTVIALRRRDRSFRTEVGSIPLEMGDSLLVMVHAAQMRQLRRRSDFIVLEANPGDQPVKVRRAVVTLGIISAAVIASIAGVPVYLSMLAGAVLVLLIKILSMEEAYQAVEWQSLFLFSGMYVVSLAIVQTGLAEQFGEAMVASISPLGTVGIAGAAFLISCLLTQIIGGQVTALVTGPIALSAAISIGANPQAVAVATAIGCSAAFMTPMAHPSNILMMTPGNYVFGDFFRAGWLLTIVCFVMLLIGVAVFW